MVATRPVWKSKRVARRLGWGDKDEAEEVEVELRVKGEVLVCKLRVAEEGVVGGVEGAVGGVAGEGGAPVPNARAAESSASVRQQTTCRAGKALPYRCSMPI